MFLREILFGKLMWERAMIKHFDDFRRVESANIHQFKRVGA